MMNSIAPKERAHGNHERFTQPMSEMANDTGLGKETSAVTSEHKSVMDKEAVSNEVRFMTLP